MRAGNAFGGKLERPSKKSRKPGKAIDNLQKTRKKFATFESQKTGMKQLDVEVSTPANDS